MGYVGIGHDLFIKNMIASHHHLCVSSCSRSLCVTRQTENDSLDESVTKLREQVIMFPKPSSKSSGMSP